MTDFRALCAELVEELAAETSLYPGHERGIVTRARAALAEPEPLTDCPSAVLKRAREINDMMAVTVYGPHEPDECAASWVTSKMLASLEARIAVLESCSATPCSENV